MNTDKKRITCSFDFEIWSYIEESKGRASFSSKVNDLLERGIAIEKEELKIIEQIKNKGN